MSTQPDIILFSAIKAAVINE